MPFVPVTIKPGVASDTTRYSSEGGWYQCDKVRFHDGYPQKFGGWVKYSGNTFLGSATALFNWITLDSKNLMAIGTNLKYYIDYGTTYHDITPIRRDVTLGTDPFETTDGDTVVVVTDTGHGAVDGDFVTFSGAVGFNGLADDDLNQEFQITFIDSDMYSVDVGVAANASGAGGGAAVDAEYQINVGQAAQTFGDGWGSGTWGRGGWGSGSSVFVATAQLRTWSQSNYGEDLLFNPRNAPIYYWDSSSGFAQRAVDLASVSGASGTPTVAAGVLFTDDRHLVAFGCNPIGSSTQDPLFIRWATQESLIDWVPTAENTAGGYRLSSGSYYIAHLKMKQETLVWTDSDLYSMQFTGAPFIFSFDFLGRNTSIAGPNAATSVGDVAFWMAKDGFYTYNGRVQTLPCSVWDHVFGDINQYQLFQVCAGTNTGFNEIIWFYCSEDSQTIDRYVVYNYLENLWYPGTLTRTAWLDSPLRPNPTGAGDDGYLYLHEVGVDDGSTTPVSAISAYIESADSDIGNGDQIMFVRRVIPDVTFVGSSAASPSITMTLKARNFPGGSFANNASATATRTATVPVEQYTEQVWVRLRGRQVVLRIESNGVGVHWQLGKVRIDAQPDGRRT